MKLRPAFILASALAACLLAGAPAIAQTWTELGPAPITGAGDVGRISAIVCSPTNANKYFVGGADGGVWRTTNGGTSWTPLTDHMPTTAIGALALDPADENIIYAGTGEGNFANHSRYGLGIYKSTDGGDTWTHLAQSTFGGRCFSRILVSPADSQRLFAAVTIAGGFPSLAAAKGHPGATGPVGVFRSDDGGVTWTHLTSGVPTLSATDLAFQPDNSQILYAAIGHLFGSPSNGVYKSLDGGDTWARAGVLPTTTTYGRISLAPAPTNPQRVYVLAARPATSSGGNAITEGLYRSDDGGATGALKTVIDMQATYGWYLSVVTVSPTSADTVFIGGLTFQRSTNAGGAFANVTPTHVDMHAAAWDASGRLVVGDDGGVQRTANNGTSWTAISTGLGTVQFYAGLSVHPTSDLIFFGGTQDNGTNRRSTDTKSWSRVIGGDGGWTQLDRSNPLRIFGEYQGTGALSRSTNGGASFSASGFGINGGDRNCFLPPYLIDQTNPQRMLYGTQRVYRSTDGGTSWNPISADLTLGAGAIRALAMGVNDPDRVYAATNDGRVLASADGGVSFALRLSGIPGWPRVTREITVDPGNARTAYLAVAAFGTDQVRRTRDAGVTWEALDGDLPDMPVNVIAADGRCPTPVLYAGTDAGLYVSADDGVTWRPYGAGLPNACVIDIDVDSVRNRLSIATQGRGAWTAPIHLQADFNNDGFADGADYDQFVNAFEAGDLAADFNGDTFVDGIDYDRFMIAFESGC